jgi:hypothetical protein
MGNTSDNIKNTVAAVGTVIGIATGGAAPPPSTSQLADAQQTSRDRNAPGRGDVTRHPTTSAKP